MRLELRTITALAQVADDTALTIGFDGEEPVTMRDGEAGLDLSRDMPWLSGAASRGAPVAVDDETGQILPATVALELAWGHEGPNAEGHYVVFGPPRPGAMYLDPQADGAEALLQTLIQAVQDGQGAAFALRDATWIEDLRPLEPDTALKMLGFGGQ